MRRQKTASPPPGRPAGPSRRALLSGLVLLPALGIGASGPGFGQAAGTGLRPFNARVLMSGHSLTDPIGDPLRDMVRSAGGTEAMGSIVELSTIPGSPMEWRWTHPHDRIDVRRDIGKFDLLVLTERVPVKATLEYHDSTGFALRYFNLAWTEGNGGRGAETILYASWINVDSGPDSTFDGVEQEEFVPFRARLDLEMARWQLILDHVNANRIAGSPPMRMIPGPLIMAAAHDAIVAGTAPGLSAITDLFLDTIHVNDTGAYLIALAHFAVIYGRDPHMIPAPLAGGPPRETAAWMKDLVWDIVRAYPDSGVS